MKARDDLVTILQAVLPPSYSIEPYARNVGAIAAPVVMLRLDEFRQSKYANGHWDVDAALLLVGPTVEPGNADEDLEDVLEDVLFAIGKSDNLVWTTAKRATYGDPDPMYPAFEITIQITTTKES